MNLKLAVVNGPNLNRLGKREQHLYGYRSWDAIWQDLEKWAQAQNFYLKYFQSNSEGALIDALQIMESQVDGVLFNPAAYSHTSIALRDCIAALSIPVVEVHITKIHQRDIFRRHSYLAEVVQASISGFGINGYLLGLDFLRYLIKERIENAK